MGRILVASASVLAVSLVAGCGHGSDSAGKAGGSAHSAAQGAKPLSVAAAENAIHTAYLSGTAVHVAVSTSEHGSPVSMDLQLNKDGTTEGTVIEHGATINLRIIGQVSYFQLTPSMLKSANASKAMSAMAGKWVTSNDSVGKGIAAAFSRMSYGRFFGDTFDSPASKKDVVAAYGGMGTVAGVPVWMYKTVHNNQMDIAVSPPHFLMKMVNVPGSDGESAGTVTFTGWNQPVKVTAPPSSDIAAL